MIINKKYTKRFSVGYNGESDFFDRVILPFKDYISSVYSAPPVSSGIVSARPTNNFSFKELLELRGKLEGLKIDFNLVYNFDGISDMGIFKELLKTANYFNPDLITLNGSFLFKYFIENSNYKLNISIINDINSLNQLYQLLELDKKKNRIISYNISRRKTYDLNFIKSVRKAFPYLNLKLMVNEGCLFECVDQNFHSCSVTMSKKNKIENHIFYCTKFETSEYWKFLSGQTIPPKFLSNYLKIVDEFKLSTRRTKTDSINKLLSEYLNEEDISIKRAIESSRGGSMFAHSKEWDAFLERYNQFLSYPSNFFKMRTTCNNNCFECDFCKKTFDDAFYNSKLLK